MNQINLLIIGKVTRNLLLHIRLDHGKIITKNESTTKLTRKAAR